MWWPGAVVRAIREGRDSVMVEATIQALNYNRRGMADGLQLDNGDIVRINGEMMAC